MTTDTPPRKRPARPTARTASPTRSKPGFSKGKPKPAPSATGADPKSAAPKPRADRPEDEGLTTGQPERIAKVMARAGLCSRREAETWITAGRVELNGKLLDTPAVTVGPKDKVLVDGTPLPMRERTRLWLYHKPRGLVTTNRDPEGRPTVFSKLPKDLPRVLAVGRLDINTEGLLLLTNDGGLARVLELPATGWLRRYRVRAFGKVTQAQLDGLAEGIAVDGVLYGAIEATLDKEQGTNVWLTVGLREGKNREVKRVLEHLGLTVNRLIRLSFGPFQLMELEEGGVREIRGRVLRDQLGDKLAEEAGADFDAPILTQPEPVQKKPAEPKKDAGARGKKPEGASQGRWLSERDGASAKSRSAGNKRPSAKGAGFEKKSFGKDAGSDTRRSGPDGGFDKKRSGNDASFDKKRGSASGFDKKRGPDAGFDRKRGGKDAGFDKKRGSASGFDKKRGPDAGSDKKRGGKDGGFDRSRGRTTPGSRDAGSRGGFAEDRPSRPPRRIWGDDGLMEDKSQEARTKSIKSGPEGRPPRRGDRS